MIAAPTLLVAAGGTWAAIDQGTASAAIPSIPQVPDAFDLGDLQNLAAAPTSHLIAIQINADGTASFAVPRAEVGQGMTTTIAMMIAEELDLPLDMVDVTLADARPELVYNQLTGGSNSIRSLYIPVRTAAAIARLQLMLTAGKLWNLPVEQLSTVAGAVKSASGLTASYASLAVPAAVSTLTSTSVLLKPASKFTMLGTPQSRIDAHDIVTGQKKFAMDLDVVPGAMPTMVARPPTINGKPKSIENLAEVLALPGVTDVAKITYGVAIRAETFGQCIDAIRTIRVTWTGGTVDGESDASVEKKLKAAALPLVVPNILTKSVDAEITFAFASNAPLEPDCAIADIRGGSGEIWSSLKIPIIAQEEIALKLGMLPTALKVHVTQGGGSFGRHLFYDVAMEAAEASQKMGKPVKLSWTRTDDFRQGRTHPMSVSRVRATYAIGNVVSYEQRHTSVRTDFTHGLGEIITATAAKAPIAGNLTFAESIFTLSQASPYNFGATTQLLNEVDLGFNTGSMRNIYSPNVVAARELVVDELAKRFGKDRLAFRREFLKDDRIRKVLDKAAEVGEWGRSLPSGVTQGIGVHNEYRSACAIIVELDCRPETVNRQIKDAVTGPRVTRATIVVDAGLALNPRGLEAQMIGAMNDGIALALTSSLHMKDGIPLEGSWDNYFYTRQWNTPLEMKVVVMPPTNGEPGGAGELATAPSFAAVACAYGAFLGKIPTYFPINHGTLSFEPYPLQPSSPQSPTDGLENPL
ncbi:molybdopterin cofactor-binding domain-containing protein [Pseudonocardia sp. GCM10023141]|uniref:molybdopterin cofactor-binding domain-containing protein n=1 Tax=Pseudonocardia sp. GCM10023141 TaxID=3252653 RepID=UPI00362377C8